MRGGRPPIRLPELTRGLVAAMNEEAASIWRSYGVEIAWVSPANLARETSLGIVDVLVDCSADTDESLIGRVLGSTRVGASLIEHVPVHVNYELTERVLAALTTARIAHATGHLSVTPEDMGRALGRILAHEIGHVLLASNDHRTDCLMRPWFGPEDLIRRGRQGGALAPDQVERLQQREYSLDVVRRVVAAASAARARSAQEAPASSLGLPLEYACDSADTADDIADQVEQPWQPLS